MTTFRFEFFGLSLVLGVLCFLFVRNVQRGRATGEIYSRSLLIRRSESPVNFWITVIVYSVFALLTAAGVMFCVAMAISPHSVANRL